ncbi:hypothetical protein SRB5_17150 [Streptomyces sp. RB5]|uniref:Uncharacterized protein n=1 Tax=Streptomyces smaragdinus TaxID=2585196 RepID=A0A7K0CE01_9ACTN|nr:hypothetical protein [Streptomyces smaragdinus]
MHVSEVAEWRARYRRCSLISAGPVEQFSPIRSMPSGSRAVSAAPISEPSSIVPVVSNASEQISGTSEPSASIARRAPRSADFVCSRSCVVSTISASAPPSNRPSAFCWKPSRITPYEMWPSVGSFVPGPIDPSTHRCRPSPAVHASAASRAIRAPAADSSWMRSAISYSPIAEKFAPKVFVSTQSTPAAKYSSCTERTMSGRVTFRTSLQPSSCSKSSSVGSCA